MSLDFTNPEHGDYGERLANLQAWARGEQVFYKLRIFNRKQQSSGKLLLCIAHHLANRST